MILTKNWSVYTHICMYVCMYVCWTYFLSVCITFCFILYLSGVYVFQSEDSEESLDENFVVGGRNRWQYATFEKWYVDSFQCGDMPIYALRNLLFIFL